MKVTIGMYEFDNPTIEEVEETIIEYQEVLEEEVVGDFMTDEDVREAEAIEKIIEELEELLQQLQR